jgi:hypothetical protein
MRRTLAVLLFLSGCVNANFTTLRNQQYDFSTVTTFYCAECADEIVSSMPRYDNKKNRELIRSAINSELVKKGYVFEEDTPDVLVEFVILIENKIDTVSQRTTNYRHWQGFETDVYNYKKGTIFVNVVNTENNTLIWQGRAESVLDKDPKNVEKNISKFVQRILRDFPIKN